MFFFFNGARKAATTFSLEFLSLKGISQQRMARFATTRYSVTSLCEFTSLLPAYSYSLIWFWVIGFLIRAVWILRTRQKKKSTSGDYTQGYLGFFLGCDTSHVLPHHEAVMQLAQHVWRLRGDEEKWHAVRENTTQVSGFRVCSQGCIAPLLAQPAETASLFCPIRSLADALWVWSSNFAWQRPGTRSCPWFSLGLAPCSP